MIKLQTRALEDVPVGGVFIALNEDVCMMPPDGIKPYIKIKEPYFFDEVPIKKRPSDFSGFGTTPNSQVAYTGVILHVG